MTFRQLPEPDKHPTIYTAPAVGESFVLVNNHDPKHLRAEFDVDHPGSHGGEYVKKGAAVWPIRISKLASNPLLRIPANGLESTARQAV